MKGILAYIGRLVLIFVITVFIAVSVVFIVPRLLPGDPLYAVYTKMAGVGEGAVSQELIAAYRHRVGFDQSTSQQYINFWERLFHGDLGYSIASFPTRVSFLLRQALPWTLGLLTFTTLVAWILGSSLTGLQHPGAQFVRRDPLLFGMPMAAQSLLMSLTSGAVPGHLVTANRNCTLSSHLLSQSFGLVHVHSQTQAPNLVCR